MTNAGGQGNATGREDNNDRIAKRIQGRLRVVIQGYAGIRPKVVSTPNTLEQGCTNGGPKTLPDEFQLCPKGQGGD